MKTTNVLLLILDQWGLHEIGIQTCLKPLPIILDGRGLHEKHEGSSADFRSKLVQMPEMSSVDFGFLECLSSLWTYGLHGMPEVPALDALVST